MRKSRFSEEQIISILREQEQGRPTPEVCRGCCQTNANRSRQFTSDGLRGQQLPPFSERRIAEVLEAGAAFE